MTTTMMLSTAVGAASFIFLLNLIAIIPHGKAWVTPHSTLKRSFPRRSELHDAVGDNDFSFPEPSSLVLSASDLERLSQMRARQKECPLLLVDNSLLPGQALELGSTDPKFQGMVTNFLKRSDEMELCIVGMHPYTGEPLSVGVTADVEKIDRNSGGLDVLTVRGRECVDVQGKPHWDERKSCYIARLEIAQDDLQVTGINFKKARGWFEELPKLLEKWCQAMQQTGRASKPDLTQRSAGGPLVDENATNAWTSRALNTAALLNPSPSWDSPVCLEIRPALLACRNDYDRLHLVHTALQASLQHLKGESSFPF